GIFLADSGKIGPGPLLSPQHRVIVFGFDGERVGTVAVDFVAQCSDHLRMTGIAALTDVDVAPRQLKRRIEPHVRVLLDRLMDGEERRDFDQAADAGDHDDPERQANALALQPVVKSEQRHEGYSAGCGATPTSAGTGWSSAASAAASGRVTVSQML